MLHEAEVQNMATHQCLLKQDECFSESLYPESNSHQLFMTKQ